MMRKESNYKAPSTAEKDMTLHPDSSTARHGKAAAAKGGATLETVLGGAVQAERAVRGSPSIDPHTEPGRHSRSRTVRFSDELNAQLGVVARAQGRRPTDVLREALADHLAAHSRSRP